MPGYIKFIRFIGLTTLFTIFVVFTLRAQDIKGKIIDADTRKPISGASIYLNSTSQGSTSNNEGNFKIHITDKHIPLVVSYVGYSSQTFDNFPGDTLTVLLKRKVNQLKEVTINFGKSSPGMSREEEIRIFLREFIGTQNKDCIISNLQDLSFHYDKKSGQLTANADTPLLINNKKLGYKITYFLSSFNYLPVETAFEGNYFFKEDTAGLEKKSLEKILRARQKSYLGSRMHFIRALWLNNAEKEGFEIIGDNLYNYNKVNVITDKQGQKFINLTNDVTVAYRNQTSVLKSTDNQKNAFIAGNGYYEPHIVWLGEMSTQRIGDLLPYDFKSSNASVEETTPPQIITDGKLSALIKLQNAYSKNLPIEKLYLQTDKPYYSSGDTLRFKSYLLNGDFLIPSTRSGQLYVELADENNQVVKRIMVLASMGLSWGDIALNEKEIPAGTYTLRAYTTWQRNFGEDYIFKKTVYVMPVTNGATLVKTNFKLRHPEGKDNVQAGLQFATLDGHVLGGQEIQLKIMDGKKNLLKNKITTGVDGTLDVNFDIPDKASIKNLSIIAQQANKAEQLAIPVTINRPENTDLQFMPEGGHLVAGITTKVGFKAIAEDGKGINVSGKIYNSRQQEITTFSVIHAGMGSFTLTPQADETYTAKVTLPGGITKTYPLPLISQTGTGIQVRQNTDSLIININATAELSNAGNYYLVGMARGIICYAQPINLKDGAVRKAIDNELFPTGVARFTLLNAMYQPLNERQVFIDHHDALEISITPNKQNYAGRDSIALNIHVRDKDGKPVQGVFSLAVTDNAQVRLDSTANNMANNLLLTADLRGTIENPGYYFSGDKETETDNLLLTQGWVGYDWKDIQPRQPVYTAENEFTIKGTVSNAFGKPIERSKVVLVSNHPLLFKDTLSDRSGHFTFRNLFPVDTAIFKLQALNKNSKDFNVRITMDEIKMPEFAPALITAPWYVNSDTTLLNNTKSKIAQLKAMGEFKGEGKLLKEVNIVEKKIIPGSKNLNGPGEADLIIDQEELEKAGKITLRDLLQQKIKGLHFGSFTPPKRDYRPSFELASYLKQDFSLPDEQANALADALNRSFVRPFIPWRAGYMINSQEVHFIIDGMDLDYFYDDKVEGVINMNHKDEGRPFVHVQNDTKRYQYINTYLDYFMAEDITGIELMSNDKYAANYDLGFDGYRDRMVPGRVNSFAYLEITTRSKQGPFMKVIPGTYLYKTLAFSLPKQFYRPRYTIKNSNTAPGTDLRSTIHWEPNVLTGKDGKATVSFYTSDRPNNYTVIMEGTDMNGNIGSVTQKLVPAKAP